MRTPNVDGRQPGSEGIPERAHIASSAFASARHPRDSSRTDRRRWVRCVVVVYRFPNADCADLVVMPTLMLDRLWGKGMLVIVSA